MENLIKFQIFKDNKIVHSGSCLANIFINVIPIINRNIYDFIEIEYRNNTFILKDIDRTYKENLEISKEEHEQLLSMINQLKH